MSDDNQAQNLYQTTKDYVDLAKAAKEDADKLRQEVDQIMAQTDNHQQ